MKSGKLLIAIAIGLCLALTPLFRRRWSGYVKAKCAMCHGADGGGKIGPAAQGYSQRAPTRLPLYHHRGRSQEGSAQEADRRRLGGGCQGRRRLYQEPEEAFHNAGSAPYRSAWGASFCSQAFL